MGHVEKTSGADLVRSMGFNNTTLDGSGVTIAVVDSGVNFGHKSFKKNGTSRLLYSQDFTDDRKR